MHIHTGLFDHMVLQRTAAQVSDASFSGECALEGTVRACVLQDGAVVPGFADRPVGEARLGRLTGRLQGVPVGGPYTIRLDVAPAGAGASAVIDDVLVGDVWMIAGQSNAQGFGNRCDAEPPHPLVRAYYMDDRWAVAEDPIHNLDAAVHPVHAALCGGPAPRSSAKGVGPGVSFGVEMQRRTGVPQGLIASAHGGTAMAQWDPALLQDGAACLYGAMLQRFQRNGGRMAGLIWYQGCSDVGGDGPDQYTARMQALIQALRTDCASPELPVVLAQLGRLFGTTTYLPAWNRMQDLQRRLAEHIPHCAVVPTIDLPLDDHIHIGGKGQQRLGRRMAQAMQVLTGDAPGACPPIEVAGVTVHFDRRTVTTKVMVEFANVTGELQAPGEPAGLMLVDDACATHVFHIALDGNRAILSTMLSPVEVRTRQLYHGYGMAPYCNITDAAGRALPVFGPLPLPQLTAVTPFVQMLRVSPIFPLAGPFEAVAYPQDLAGLELATRTFATILCDRYQEIRAYPGPGILYYACRLQCAEPMAVQLLLGYDGPVTVWLDGRRCFQDPRGTVPATPDAEQIPLHLTAGLHELLLAQGTLAGNAWGIFLRAQRTDQGQEARTPAPGPLPEFLG